MSDWLDDIKTDDTALSVVKKQIAEFRQKQFDVQQAEETLKYRQQQLQDCIKATAQLLRQNGLDALRLETGEMLEVVSQMKCSVIKDRKQEVADWLRDRDMDMMVSSTLIVPESYRSQFDEQGVPYDEDLKMNTNSIKAYVKSEMEAGNLKLDEVPKGLSVYVYDDIRIKD